MFDEGHSYADGVFSTRTTIVDTIAGTAIGELESWKVTRDGAPFASPDFNFWGVTFAPDGNTFYATLRTKGSAYLIEGDVDARTAKVLMQGAECPSLSPDRARIAFKKRLGGSGGWWQLSLYDLSTHAVRALSGDTESVDDQVEWLDAANLIYFRPNADGNIIWRLPADTGGPPQPFVREGLLAGGRPVARMLKRSAIFVHRWLGVALCLFFLLWFPSGDRDDVLGFSRRHRRRSPRPRARARPGDDSPVAGGGVRRHRPVAAAVAGAAEHVRRPARVPLSRRARRRDARLRGHRRAADRRSRAS